MSIGSKGIRGSQSGLGRVSGDRSPSLGIHSASVTDLGRALDHDPESQIVDLRYRPEPRRAETSWRRRESEKTNHLARRIRSSDRLRPVRRRLEDSRAGWPVGLFFCSLMISAYGL